MNWYKESQQNISLDNIVESIDKLIIKNYDFTIEELGMTDLRMNGFQDETRSIAAQVTTRPKRSPVKVDLPKGANEYIFELFHRGYTPKQIAKKTGIPFDKVYSVVKSKYPTKKDEKRGLEEKYPSINEVNHLIEKMQKTLEIISRKTLSNYFGVSESLMIKILDKYNIRLSELVLERKFKVEEEIVKIANDPSIPSDQKSIAEAFNKTFKHKINKSVVYKALLYRNSSVGIRENIKNRLYTAFRTFMSQQRNDKTFLELAKSDELLVKKIDEFINRYGKFFGFISPMDQQKLKELFMTKVQLRDRSKEQVDLGSNLGDYVPLGHVRNKVISLIEEGASLPEIAKQTGVDKKELQKFYQLYNLKNQPMIYDESHPSHFISNKGDNNELV